MTNLQKRDISQKEAFAVSPKSEVNFESGNIRGVNLMGVDLSDAHIRGANLRGIILECTAKQIKGN